MQELFSHQCTWPAVVCLLLIGAYTLIQRKKKPVGEPVTPATVAGMFAGKPEAWKEFRRLLQQPDPPDPADAIRAIVREEIGTRSK